MADPTPEQQQERYAAIELLYSEGKWSEVLQASEALLAALPPVQNHPLRARLDLVIGHTLLYGLANPNAAEQRYRTVLLETEEPVLREIAEQGLVRCDEQRGNSEALVELEATSDVESPETAEANAEAMTGEFAAETSQAASTAETDALIASSAVKAEPTAGQLSGAAAMPWETAVEPGVVGDGGLSNSSSSSSSGSNAAMPWLAELGIEAPASGDALDAVAAEPLAPAPFANQPISDSVRTVRNSETTNLQEPPLHMGAVEEPERPAAIDAAQSPTTEETLALLREPDELIPVTIQVLEETPPAPQAAAPEPAKEEPPLSPDEMAELARGLLEVVLR